MADEKDPLGERLKEKERAEEERYFRQREKEAIERLRQKQSTTEGHMTCPKDGTPLQTVSQFGVTVEECPTCRGMWLDPGELETIAKRERDSWLSRLFFRSGR